MATITQHIRIHAAPETVFKALSTKEGLESWFTTNIEGDVRQGETALFRFPKNETFRWKFAELTPSRVVWECLDGPGVAKGTTATFHLSPDGVGDTLVTCGHENWPEGHKALETCDALWGILLGHLREYAETGKLVPVY